MQHHPSRFEFLKHLAIALLLFAGLAAASAIIFTTSVTAQGGSVCDTVTEIPQSECQALETLYNSTNGDNWRTNIGWLQDDTPCDWYGVTCSGGHVTELQLQGNNLDGPLPPEIGDLPELTKLVLSANLITGNFSDTIGNLTKVEWFLISNNKLTGTLPSAIGNLTNTVWFDISGNQIEDALPSEIGNLTKVQKF